VDIKSLRKLAIELKKKGREISPTLVGNLLHDMDYSLQANSKTIEDDEHIDRDDQFQYINNQAKMFPAAKQPVISVDPKKKELAWISEGASQSWCSPAGESPARVGPSEPPGSKCCCVKKTRRRHAVREMKEGPSEPPCRRRLQTATSCFG
jgi:hypothetical protein